MVLPRRPVETEVGVPGYADPIKFEALDLKLGRRVLEVKAGTSVVRWVEKPKDGIDFDADVDGVRLEALGLGGGDQTESLGTAGVLADPLFGQIEAASESDGITRRNFGQHLTSCPAFAIQDGFNECGHVFGAKRAHRNGEVEAAISCNIGATGQGLQSVTSGVLTIG